MFAHTGNSLELKFVFVPNLEYSIKIYRLSFCHCVTARLQSDLIKHCYNAPMCTDFVCTYSKQITFTICKKKYSVAFTSLPV